jgi:hypothetical protein
MCITEDRNCIGIELKKKPSLRSYPYRRAASSRLSLLLIFLPLNAAAQFLETNLQPSWRLIFLPLRAYLQPPPIPDISSPSRTAWSFIRWPSLYHLPALPPHSRAASLRAPMAPGRISLLSSTRRRPCSPARTSPLDFAQARALLLSTSSFLVHAAASCSLPGAARACPRAPPWRS